MIEIDFDKQTFTCPYCGRVQSYSSANMEKHYAPTNGYNRQKNEDYTIVIYHIKCSNAVCGKYIIVGSFFTTHKQFDILPQYVHKNYPNYIPKQIRDDYTEAADIIELSPKAAATLFRRCLQGMIHDFWNIHEKNLNAEITKLQGKVSSSMWNAIDGLRKMGNIGAHMEGDVNLVIDIDISEAKKLQKLIELLFDKWYIARHDEEELLNDVSGISDEKQVERETNKNARDER